MLRGPQTIGELKQRSDRLHSFASLDAIAETLDRLAGRELAARVPRRPGQKEDRYMQLLGGAEESPAVPQPLAAPSDDRLERIEERLERLERQLDELQMRLGNVPARD
jgi:hypothetical protein